MNIRLRACAAAVQDGRVLLVPHPQRDGRTRWYIPGGGLEVGESLEEAARREMREETGLEIALQGILDVSEVIRSDGHGLHVCFRARIVGGELRPEPSRPDHLPRWFSRPELEALPLRWPHLRDVLLNPAKPLLTLVLERA